MRSFLGLILILFIGACQNLPTRSSNEASLSEKLFGSSEEKLAQFLETKPAILDVRGPLDFSVSHPPHSISVNWRDFSRTGSHERGWLLDDDFAIARRLSLWGIDPDTPVLVLGYGREGHGEEGRIAWMLKYLGVKDVQIAEWKVVRSTIPREENPPRNKPIWKPKVKKDYLATSEEFKRDILEGRPPTVEGPVPVVLDVTEASDQTGIFPKNIGVKKIPWKNFISDRGLPDQNARELLDKNKLTKDEMIYVISENGLSSALVTFVLRDWGYKAANFAGGYEYLK